MKSARTAGAKTTTPPPLDADHLFERVQVQQTVPAVDTKPLRSVFWPREITCYFRKVPARRVKCVQTCCCCKRSTDIVRRPFAQHMLRTWHTRLRACRNSSSCHRSQTIVPCGVVGGGGGAGRAMLNAVSHEQGQQRCYTGTQPFMLMPPIAIATLIAAGGCTWYPCS
jgi:hypothetical protein